MEHLILYYSACLMGVVCLISILAIYKSNRRTLKDLREPEKAKSRWIREFVQERETLLKEHTKIHNPSVYVIKRMRGRKIGPWKVRQLKGISWGSFILSFLLLGMNLFLLYQKKQETLALLWPEGFFSAKDMTVITGSGMGIVLLGTRLILGTGYQEEEIETNLLDYIENHEQENLRPKVVTMEAKAQREKAQKELEQGILEMAASDSRYQHLLNQEETNIVKDVVKEFLNG